MNLHEAVASGDPEAILTLLNAGADIGYVRPHGYTVMVDVMFGRSIHDDRRLIEVLRILIERGADLDAVTDYGESALSVASRLGRFDAVALLLEAGADPAPLGWSPLHRAVATGSLEEVRARIDLGDDLKALDGWNRTPWLLSLQTRDLARAGLLLHSGADLNDQGRCGKTALMHAIEGNDPEMLRWLLEQGLDPDATDDFGVVPLIKAAENCQVECVRLLLSASASANLGCEFDMPIRAAANLEIARMLADAGADFTEVNTIVRDELTKRRKIEEIDCSPEDFHAAKHPIFGDANPQLMNFPFWHAMVASRESAYAARSKFGHSTFDAPAIWCYARFGMSLTQLPDGRVIEIGGEHEDYYDPDFCIYNDVIVHHGDGTFDIHGYPEDVFPPTDFHSATLVGDGIYLVGSLGYDGRRRYGTTQIYRLDIASLRMEAVETKGSTPGWIHRHRATLVGNTIEVSGGLICLQLKGKECMEALSDRHSLDLRTMRWSKL